MEDFFLFGLVFIKKIIIKPNLKKKKTKLVQTDQFWFGCLDKNQFGSVFSV
jgi:hypothetical protein